MVSDHHSGVVLSLTNAAITLLRALISLWYFIAVIVCNNEVGDRSEFMSEFGRLMFVASQ